MDESQIIPNLQKISPIAFKSQAVNERFGLAQIVILILVKNNPKITQKAVIENLLSTKIYENEASANAAVSRNIDKLISKSCLVKEPGNLLSITIQGISVLKEYCNLAKIGPKIGALSLKQASGRQEGYLSKDEVSIQNQISSPNSPQQSQAEDIAYIKEFAIVVSELQKSQKMLSEKLEMIEKSVSELKLVEKEILAKKEIPIKSKEEVASEGIIIDKTNEEIVPEMKIDIPVSRTKEEIITEEGEEIKFKEHEIAREERALIEKEDELKESSLEEKIRELRSRLKRLESGFSEF